MTVTVELINAAKMAGRITTDAYNDQIRLLLDAALLDLGCAGVTLPVTETALAKQAAITYFLANFGNPQNYDRLKASYDEQKAQLATRTGYTTWSTTPST